MVEEQLQDTEVQDTPVKSKNISKEVLYQMDADPLKVKINVYSSDDRSQTVTHTLRKPTFAEEEAKERMAPLIITDSGKVDGAEASSMSLDEDAACERLFNKIAISVNGYALERGSKPEDKEVSVDTVLNVNGEDKLIKDLIPISHKTTAIGGLYPADYEVDFGDEEFYFALGGGREWKVRQDIGGKDKREDGTLSDPDFTVYYIFREPTQAERKKFRTQAISALTLRTATGNKDRRSTNLKVISELFDALIQSIEGATIAGTSIDVRDKKQLELIPANFKKGTIIRLQNFLEADFLA